MWLRASGYMQLDGFQAARFRLSNRAVHGADCFEDIIEAVLGEGKYEKVHKDMMTCNIFIIKAFKNPGIAYMERTPALKLNLLINQLKDDDELRGQITPVTGVITRSRAQG